MNLSLPDQSMHGSGEGGLDEDKPEVLLPCFRRNMYEEPLPSTPYSSGSIISQLLRKTLPAKRAMEEGHYYLCSADSGQEDRSSVSSKDSMAEAASPNVSTGASLEGEHPISDHLQAKRARVENIIRVMAGSPTSRPHGDVDKSEVEVREGREVRDPYRENKRKQRLPQHQEHNLDVGRKLGRDSSSKDEECHRLKEQLHSMQRLLQQLQEKFLQVYNQEDPDDEMNLDESTESRYVSSEEDFDRKNTRVAAECKDRVKLSYIRDSLEDTLKEELSRAVGECVDRVFRKMTPTGLDMSPPQRMCSSPDISVERKAIQEPAQSDDTQIKTHSLDYYEESHSPQDQTEALSLVVRKPVVTPLSAPSVKRPFPVHQSPFQFNYSAPLHDSQILEHLLKYGPHSNFLPCMPTAAAMDRGSPDTVDLPWDAIAMRSKVTSGHLGHHPRPSALGPVTVDNLCLPHVKLECAELQGMAERNPYMSLNIQEGLTPSHLKKAKLMFFYTRYPSSNVLKTYFPDVKFNRCITSQLIKWFSNFREFYYIQMEKFARQAIVDGVGDVKDITVSRDSELFRALNMHYNKANDFHVPERFLEVAEITLHEFYNAISASKDSDPSWKKAIYKVICKLDSEVPEEFKTSSYL
ncbi:prospero homeobox protein 2 [Periophthalmus magnuspinnatus]|uniref:prospero homeobox protein 2 n=1 Tax=Periophthalmus magnuspinnatus TaxID=409849 RepID=UPI00145A28E5|nr:prospero homeobox protein 2 [Periophthalmus magnuspinnatus]